MNMLQFISEQGSDVPHICWAFASICKHNPLWVDTQRQDSLDFCLRGTIEPRAQIRQHTQQANVAYTHGKPLSKHKTRVRAEASRMRSAKAPSGVIDGQ